jgi:membrane protease YdiL (CAAX protease family)
MKQLIVFFILACFISWLIWLPLYGHIFGIKGLPVIPFHHAIGAMGPLLASVITTFIFLKKAGLVNLFSKSFQIKPLLFLVLALLGPFVLAFMAIMVSSFLNDMPLRFSVLLNIKEFPGVNLFTFFCYNLVFFGLGEEAGWRGFALPRIQIKLNALSASVVLSIFWALWHIPLFFYRPGYISMEWVGIFGWFLSLMTGSILLTWLYNSTKGSILICAVFHATIDIVFTADFADKTVVNYMGFLITVCAVLIILVYKPNNLSKNRRVTFSRYWY